MKRTERLRILLPTLVLALAQADPHFLEGILKSQGKLVWQYANGIDNSEVITEPPPNKGYGNSLTTPRDVCDKETAQLYLLSLAETVSARLRADSARAEVVAVNLRITTCGFTGTRRNSVRQRI